jgi:transposase-like protein
MVGDKPSSSRKRDLSPKKWTREQAANKKRVEYHFGGNEMKKRMQYTAEFKRGAVRLYETSGKIQAQIGRDLGLWRGCIDGLGANDDIPSSVI